MFVHVFEPHADYIAHPEFPEYKGSYQALYDGEVAFADMHLGRFLDALAASSIAHNTAVVVTSDHGEAFGDHTMDGQAMVLHGRTLFDDETRVPLVFYLPGQRPSRVDTSTSLIDLMPTLLDVMQLEVPGVFRGRSLAAALFQGKAMARAVFGELLPYRMFPNHPARSVVDAESRYKLINRYFEDKWSLYDLQSDPGETTDVSDKHPAALNELSTQLRAWKDGLRIPPVPRTSKGAAHVPQYSVPR